MYERWNDHAQKVMTLANQEAARWGHEYIGTEHILLALIQMVDSTAISLLRQMGVNIPGIKKEVERILQSGPELNLADHRLPQTPRAKNVVKYAMEEAQRLGHNYVGAEHILLGLLREKEGLAGEILLGFELEIEKVREKLLESPGSAKQAPLQPDLRALQVDLWRRLIVNIDCPANLWPGVFMLLNMPSHRDQLRAIILDAVRTIKEQQTTR